MKEITTLTEALLEQRGRNLVVLTGAGISLASGIATFRGEDPGAIWKNDVTEKGTIRFFEQNPVESWRWYMDRFMGVLEAKPNPAHFALADLERWWTAQGGKFLLITQNVDPLHERAGSKELVKVHGTADRVRCKRRGCVNGEPHGSLPREAFDTAAFLAEPTFKNLPRCPICNALVRQHVLWFDEYYSGHDDYQYPRVEESFASLDLLLFIGTSFSVGVTEAAMKGAGDRGKPIYVLDPGLSPAAVPWYATLLAAKAESILPPVVALLKESP